MYGLTGVCTVDGGGIYAGDVVVTTVSGFFTIFADVTAEAGAAVFSYT